MRADNVMLKILDYFRWNGLRALLSAEVVPEAISALLVAESKQDAERQYWRIDSNVISEGRLYQAALPTIVCLQQALLSCTSVSRPFILELLVQLGSGDAAPEEVEMENHNLGSDCRRELCRGSAIYFALLEETNGEEEDFCIDLLGLCALVEECEFRTRVIWNFQELIVGGSTAKHIELAKNWVKKLSSPI